MVAADEHTTDDGSIDVPRFRHVIEEAPPIDAAAVRLVHGADMIRSPTLVDDSLLSRLAGLIDLAPLHNAAAIQAVEVLREVMPGAPIVVCVDTAFHATIPEDAATYAIPWDWTRRYGLKKYGFHGLSHRYASRRAAELLDRPVESLRVVTCHLGAGGSLAAICGGVSVDTTMGFTPLDGLVMATRAGSVDPGLLLWIQRARGNRARPTWKTNWNATAVSSACREHRATYESWSAPRRKATPDLGSRSTSWCIASSPRSAR